MRRKQTRLEELQAAVETLEEKEKPGEQQGAGVAAAQPVAQPMMVTSDTWDMQQEAVLMAIALEMSAAQASAAMAHLTARLAALQRPVAQPQQNRFRPSPNSTQAAQAPHIEQNGARPRAALRGKYLARRDDCAIFAPTGAGDSPFHAHPHFNWKGNTASSAAIGARLSLTGAHCNVAAPTNAG